MRKNDIPSKISILEHDSFLKMKNKSQSLLEYILSYNISKIGRKTINIYGDTVKFATVDVFVRATLYNNWSEIRMRITRRRKLSFSNLIWQLKYRYDPNLWFKKNGMFSVENFLGYNLSKAHGKLSRNNGGIAHERRQCRFKIWENFTSHREYTQNEKKLHTLKSLNFRASWLSQNEKVKYFFIRVHPQLQHIENWAKNDQH